MADVTPSSAQHIGCFGLSRADGNPLQHGPCEPGSHVALGDAVLHAQYGGLAGSISGAVDELRVGRTVPRVHWTSASKQNAANPSSALLGVVHAVG